MNDKTFNRAVTIDKELRTLRETIVGIKNPENVVRIYYTWPGNSDVGVVDSDPYKLNKYLRAEVLEVLEMRERVLTAKMEAL